MWELFSTNSDTAGFRLQYMEGLNWGNRKDSSQGEQFLTHGCQCIGQEYLYRCAPDSFGTYAQQAFLQPVFWGGKAGGSYGRILCIRILREYPQGRRLFYHHPDA